MEIVEVLSNTVGDRTLACINYVLKLGRGWD